MIRSEISPFKVFWDWVYDGEMNSKIPDEKIDKNGNIIVPDILNYKSPITPYYLLKTFSGFINVCEFMNKYFNNYNVMALKREDFFKFIKKMVSDLKIRRNRIPFIKSSFVKKDKLFLAIQKNKPYLTEYEIEYVKKLITKNNKKLSILSALGVEPGVLKKKIKVKKKKIDKKETVKDFFKKNFEIVESV